MKILLNEDYKGNYFIYFKKIQKVYYSVNINLQLVYVVDGSISYSTNDVTYKAKEGELIIISPYENRFLYSEDSDEAIVLVLNIDNDYLNSLGDLALNIKFKNHIDKSSLDEDLIIDLVSLYIIDNQTKDFNKVRKNLESIIYKVVKSYMTMDSLPFDMHDKIPILESICNIIDNGKGGNLSLKYISDEINLSTSYVSKLFREFTGLNFTEYAQQYRLYLSILYLLHTKKNIEEISEIIGFSSAKSLNRIFSKFLNTTPSQYRENFSKTDSIFEDNTKVQILLNKSKTSNYTNFLNCYYKGETINIDISKSEKTNIEYKNWATVRNLGSLGKDYIGSLDFLNNFIDLDEINLRFYWNKKEKEFYLADINKPISNMEFSNIFGKCIDYNITPIISLTTDRIKYENIDKSYIDENLKIFKSFYDLISFSVGSNNMKKFKYTIDVDGIIEYIDNPDAIESYRIYIKGQKEIISKKLGFKEFIWGPNLGNIENVKISQLEYLYKKLHNYNDYKLSFVCVYYSNTTIKMISSISELKKLEKHYKKIMENANELRKKLNIACDKVYVQGTFDNLDITSVDKRYRNLFIISLMMRSTFRYSKDIKYIVDYKVKDKKELTGFYNEPIIDTEGFPTALYWTLYLMRKLEGQVIHNSDGILAINSGQDLDLLIYSNSSLNYIYGINKNFENLEDDKYNLNLKIKGLKGNYKVITYVISYYKGNPYYFIGGHKNVKYLSISEKDHIKKISRPDFKIDIRKIEGDFNDTILYSPFDIILRKYIKI